MNTLTKRIHKLPLELRLWCIIPYTYKLQNKELLRDIRTYYTDMNILDNIYGTQYNSNILLHDLKIFCLLPQIPFSLYNMNNDPDEVNNTSMIDLPRCFTIWKRYFINKGLNNVELLKKMLPFLSNNQSISRKIHFIFGLLTVEERNRFIEKHIIDIEDND